MNRAFSPSLVRPNLPLRRPASGPGLMVIRNQTPVLNCSGSGSPQECPPASVSLDAEAHRKEDCLVAAKDNSVRDVPLPTSLMVKLCNYCSQQGNLRCTRCKKTCYCSVACQSEDWKAHRHICKPSTQENGASLSVSDKAKECQTMPSGSGPRVLESRASANDVVQPKRIFLSDLRKNSISKGDEMQGVVVELINPGKFFVRIQSVEMTLRSITFELQKTYGNSHTLEYKPEVGELCAVKFSLDQNWYRGEVESVDSDRRTAKVLYIDFGNEEDVAFDKIRALAENLDLAPPCALQCCVAGVTAVTGSWTGECSFAVRQLVAGKNLTFTVKDTMNSGNLLAVDASLSMLGKNLSTFLIDQGYAIKEDTPTKPSDINSLLTASFENFKRLSVGKNDNVEAQPPEPLTQAVGDTFTAIVTHLQSPLEIICQKLENASAIQQLQMSLREHCTKAPASGNFRPAPGTVCCSLFSEDNQWYRAIVLAYSSDDRVCVGYIDFGNSEEVQLNHLRPISAELLALASQAIPCALAGIKPASDVWSEDVIMMLKRLVCNRFIQVEILGQQDGMALVSMIDESSDPQTNVAEMLVATGYAAVGNMETTKDAAKDVVFENPAREKLDWSCAELPIDGQEVVLVISVLENPGEFYCYNYNARDMQTLAELSSDLMKHCETEKAPFIPAVGEPCCALFSGDGSWYRAMVQSVEDGKARVCFVDYGNSCEVQAAHLRAIDPSLLKHPFQALRCCLAGVEPMGGQWKEAAVQRFQALCVGKQLSGRVLSITEKGYGVELTCSGQNIAAVLIAEQLAKPSGQNNEPTAQQNRPSDLTEASHAQMPIPTETVPLVEQQANVTIKGADTSQPNVSIASFPLDWKSVELPCRETFQPQVAAVTSPSLFYVMNPREVKVEMLQAVMTDVAKYCSRQALPNQRVPVPGAACCAQFSVDKNWCRAVVLDTTSTHVNVIYADFGNCERIPISNILPIPKELLQHPFQITRCALAGIENFPTVWPTEVLELFAVQLSGKVLASVQDFDGTYNLLMLKQHSGLEGNINAVILGALQKVPGKASAEGLAQDQGEPQAGSALKTKEHASADTEKPGSQEKKNMKTVMTTVENVELQDIPGPKGVSNTPVPSCCCDALKLKLVGVLLLSSAAPHNRVAATAEELGLQKVLRRSERSSEMFCSIQLLLAILLTQVGCGLAVQEIQTDHETILKISTAGKMMKCSAVMDVLFVMDGSHSVGKGGFERSRHCVLKLCEALDIGPDTVRVGVIQFGSSPRLEISLDSYSSREDLKKRIKKIHYRGGSTQTGLVLKYVLRKGFPGRGNSTVSRVVILLTDGKSQGAVQAAAAELKQSGVLLFAMGVRYPRWEELHSLASVPVESHVFFAEHFSDTVNGVLTSLSSSSSICTAVPSGCTVESYSCVQKTLENVKQLQGNFMCWKGSKGYSPYTSLCPYYRHTKAYKELPTVCHRTVCSDPCDSHPCQNGGTCVSEGLEKYRCECPAGYGSDPNCAPLLTLDCSVDVLFLVESSTALTLEGFLRFKSFLKRFMQAVLSSDTPVKIGLAQYSSDVKTEATVGQYRQPVKLVRAVESLQYRKGEAKTGNALRHVTRHGFQSAPVFADVQDDLPRVVVLITGSPSADPVVEPAKYARDREIFIIGVAPEGMREEINNITGNPQRTITYSNPDRLSAKIPELRAKICSVDNQGCLGQAVDLIFVLDASASVGKDNFVHLQDFVRSTSVQFDVNRDVAQVGMVVYGRRPVSVFELDTHDSGSAVLRAVGDASFLGGKGSTGSALLHVHSHSLTVGKGARPGVNKAVVVLTDGTGADDAAVPAQKLRDNGVSVFVIGTGDVQRESLLRIAGSEDHVITVPYYEDLKYFEDVLVQMVCADVKKPVNLCRPNPCMNDGVCVILNKSYRCECRGWEGPHCETRSRQQPSRGDLPNPAAQRQRHRLSSTELRQRYREHRRRHAGRSP